MTDSAEDDENDAVTTGSGRDGRLKRRSQGKGRMEAFSDGVLAVAITLLVLDLAISYKTGHSDLLGALVDEWPAYLGFLVSFATIGTIWLGHSAITDYLDRVDATFLRLNLLLLFFVCLLPFATGLLAEFINAEGAERVAATSYGLLLLLCSLLLSLLWRYARREGLLVPDLEDDEVTLLTMRVTPGIGAYVVLIIIGWFFPRVAVIGYLAIAVFLLLPFRFGRRPTTEELHERQQQQFEKMRALQEAREAKRRKRRAGGKAV